MSRHGGFHNHTGYAGDRFGGNGGGAINEGLPSLLYEQVQSELSQLATINSEQQMAAPQAGYQVPFAGSLSPDMLSQWSNFSAAALSRHNQFLSRHQFLQHGGSRHHQQYRPVLPGTDSEMANMPPQLMPPNMWTGNQHHSYRTDCWGTEPSQPFQPFSQFMRPYPPSQPYRTDCWGTNQYQQSQPYRNDWERNLDPRQFPVPPIDLQQLLQGASGLVPPIDMQQLIPGSFGRVPPIDMQQLLPGTTDSAQQLPQIQIERSIPGIHRSDQQDFQPWSIQDGRLPLPVPGIDLQSLIPQPISDQSSDASRRIVASAQSDIGKAMWQCSPYAACTVNGQEGCAASVSEVLKQSGFSYANSAGVSGLADQLMKHGWTKINVANHEERICPGDVIYGIGVRQPQDGAHIAIVGERQYGELWEYDNKSSTGRWVHARLQDSALGVNNSARFGKQIWVLRPPA